MTSLFDRRMNAAYKLNADAYKLTKKRHGKRGTYTPCEKARVLQCSREQHIGLLEQEVLATPCECHNGLTHEKLIDMEFDDSHKLSHWGLRS